MNPRARALRLTRPLDLVLTLGLNARGRGDPTMRVTATDAMRATHTTAGPVALHLIVRGDELDARAWGPGAELALADLPRLIGEDDESADVPTANAAVRELEKHCRGMRIGRTGAVIEALVPAVLEQKITGAEARRVYRGLVLAFGERAPGPLGLHVPVSASTLAQLPYWSFHRVGLERRRAEVIKAACRVAERLEATCAGSFAEGYKMLTSINGIGEWTAAEIGARAYGDPDVVSLGDFHLPHLVSWALARERRGTDERMLELLAPFAGRRGRIVRLIEARAPRPPRYAPRSPERSIAGL